MEGTDSTNIGRRRESAKADGGAAYEARRDEIIEAAGQVFLRLGFEAATFKHIADEVGLDRASLYYYFASKQEIFQAATGAAVLRNTEAAEQVATGDAAPADKVAEIISLVIRSYTKTDFPYMYIFLQEDVPRIASDDAWVQWVGSLSRRYEAAVSSIFDEGVARGVFATDVPAAIITKAIIGMANWTQRWFNPDGELSSDEIAALFTHLVLHGAST